MDYSNVTFASDDERSLKHTRVFNKRHPVICRYRDDCKFYKTNSCAFKHINMETNKASKDFENKVEVFAKEIESLNSEIMELRSDINYKKKELHKSKLEVQELTEKLALLHKNKNSEKDIMEENDDLIKQVEMLKKENIALKMKLAKKIPIDDEKNALQLEEKDDTKITKEIFCEKCCLKFLSNDKLKKHKSEMHKAMLTF